MLPPAPSSSAAGGAPETQRWPSEERDVGQRHQRKAPHEPEAYPDQELLQLTG